MELLNISNIASFIATLLAFITSASLVLVTRNRLEEMLKKNIEERSAAHNKLIGELTKTIRPRVVHCSKPEEVTREAIELIRAATNTKKRHELERARAAIPTTITIERDSAIAMEANSQEKDSYDVVPDETNADSISSEIDFITFYGAANLSGEDNSTDYRDALSNAVQQELRIRRYICLYEQADLKDRDPEIKLKYFQWLARQYDTLDTDPGFQLVHNPRVPQWWANSATLLTYDAVMEIKGNGTAAVAIHDHPIAATIRESLRDAREGAANSNKKVFSGDKRSLKDLADRIREGCEENHISLKAVAEDTHSFKRDIKSLIENEHEVS